MIEASEARLSRKESPRTRCELAVVLLLALTGGGVAEEPGESELAAWAAQLVRAGTLKVEYYDPARPPKALPGWTDFEFELRYQYEYTTSIRARKASPDSVTIVPQFRQVEVPIQHRILLPDPLKGTPLSGSSLGRHELDHVQIGQHPRIVLLGRELVVSLRRVVVAHPAGDLTAAWIQKQIDDQIGARRDALEALVRTANQELDRRTEHGRDPLAERQEFFDGLFSKQQLHDQKFPFLTEVLAVVNSPAYQRARLTIPMQDPRR